MFDDLKQIPSQELIDCYNANKKFIDFLNKEIANAEKMRDENE